jgi:hypothetical protein
MSLPIDDGKLILGASDTVSSITETSSSMPSRSSLGRGRQPLLGIATNAIRRRYYVYRTDN